jgi:D-lactate dehydrogenase
MSAVLEWAPAASVKLGADHSHLVSDLKTIVGDKYVLTDESKTRRYRKRKRLPSQRGVPRCAPSGGS